MTSSLTEGKGNYMGKQKEKKWERGSAKRRAEREGKVYHNREEEKEVGCAGCQSRSVYI